MLLCALNICHVITSIVFLTPLHFGGWGVEKFVFYFRNGGGKCNCVTHRHHLGDPPPHTHLPPPPHDSQAFSQAMCLPRAILVPFGTSFVPNWSPQFLVVFFQRWPKQDPLPICVPAISDGLFSLLREPGTLHCRPGVDVDQLFPNGPPVDLSATTTWVVFRGSQDHCPGILNRGDTVL